MKGFINAVRKNIFYIALVGGLGVLVGLVAIYNIKTEDESEINLSENETDTEALPTLGEGDKADEVSEKVDTEEISEEISEAENDVAEAEENSEEENDQELTTEELHYDGTESLIWPLNGNVIIPYSMDRTVLFDTLNEYKCNPGMMIEAEVGQEVQSVYKGEVISLTTSSEFGNMLIVSLGDGYEVTYGQLLDVNVAVGDIVEAGDIIGTVAEPTSYYTKEGTNLYFKITRNGNPVDPTLLIQ
jgi:septal ring factor EnvC (AmiA/AmiB activator)